MNCNSFRRFASVFFACLYATSFFCVVGALQPSGASAACSASTDTNVSSGILIGPRKFTVSTADCCNLCSQTSLCVGAVFSNYYCTMFSDLVTLENSSTSTLLRVPTSPPPTTAAPTPVPTTPAPTPLGPPKGFALLTQCSVSNSCQRASDPTCVTEVIPIDSCVSAEGLHLDSSSVGSPPRQQIIHKGTTVEKKTATFISVTPLASNQGVQRHEFETSDCSGRPVSSILFPATCTYEVNDYVSRMGTLVTSSVPPTNQSSSYVVEGMQCSNADCTMPNGCSMAFSGACDECFVPSSSSSSSESSSGSGVIVSAVSYHCFTDQQMVAIFPFSSSEDCVRGQRVGGRAYPTGQCYYNDAEEHFYNLCNPA